MSSLSRRLQQEHGVAMVVIMGVLLVLSIIAAGVLANAIASNRQSLSDRRGKVALDAALTGVRTAVYRLNTSAAQDVLCPAYPTSGGGSTTSPVNGICGPYSSSDAGSAQPAPNEKWQFWMTPTLSTPSNPGGISADTCTGTTPSSGIFTSFVIRERCITALGQAIDPNGNVVGTRRVQVRLAANGPIFPVPGIWGTDCVQVGKGTSGAFVIGAIGSNGTGGNCGSVFNGQSYDIDLNVATWGDSTNTVTFNSKPYYMGGDVYFGRNGSAANVLPTASILYSAVVNVTNPTAFPPTYTSCAGCPVGASGGTGACGTNVTSATKIIAALCTADQATGGPIDMGRHVSLKKVEPFFQSPPPPASGALDSSGRPIYGCTTAATSPATGCTNPSSLTVGDSNICQDTTSPFGSPATAPCDTARRNDNATGITQNANCTGTAYSAGTVSSSTGIARSRSLSLNASSNTGPPCIVTLKNGVYNFCSINFTKNTKIEPFDTSTNAEVYVFIDSSSRTVLPDTAGGSSGAACASGNGVGNVSTPTGAGSNTSFMDLATTALAGQLYFYGDGDNATSFSHKVIVPNGWSWKGLVFAPNSIVDLNPGATLMGGLAARDVQVENNATYAWDVGVQAVNVSNGRVNYQVSQFTSCTRTIRTIGGTQFPMDGC